MAIRTLIVDDSVLFRKVLSDALASFTNVEVLGTAPGGKLALKKLAQTPADLVLLDVHMEEMDGIETLRQIRKDFPDTKVVMVSGISTRNADSTIQALEIGALDFIRKPDGKDYDANLAELKTDLRSVLRLIETKLLASSSLRLKKETPASASPSISPVSVSPSQPQRTPSISVPPPDSFSVLAIGVSTGGPEALARVIPLLPANLGVPVVLVQHMPPNFTKSLADSLSKKSKLPVVEVQEGDEIIPNRVHIAPGGFHFVVKGTPTAAKVSINSDPPENSCRPAVDVLFRSVAEVYGDRGVLAVILTGMGNDGMRGVSVLKRKKCFCLSQTESSCVVYGMPKAVDDARLTDESVPLDKMALRIAELIQKRR
ncbi:MAG: chemotaxis-specific protein-glutamate methyltransferase CheB [Fibrobacteres bacterium]|nr:chemotaxis-specific protein-glutamate methyltransferase CheB [Fibrobacterota bacterium]